MEFSLKLLNDNVDFTGLGVNGYTVIIQKEGLEIKDLENLMKILCEECYSINNVKLLGNSKVKIQGNIEDGVTIVDDIFSMIEAVKEEKSILISMLQQAGFYNSDIELIISKLC